MSDLKKGRTFRTAVALRKRNGGAVIKALKRTFPKGFAVAAVGFEDDGTLSSVSQNENEGLPELSGALRMILSDSMFVFRLTEEMDIQAHPERREAYELGHSIAEELKVEGYKRICDDILNEVESSKNSPTDLEGN